jgi:hypothetical protein
MKNKQEVLKNIMQIAPKFCDVCGSQYQNKNFNVVKNEGQQLVVHLKCSNCGNGYMLNIFNPMHGVFGTTRSQVNLDIESPKEMIKFASSKSLSINEALDAHNILMKSPVLDYFLEKNKNEPLTPPTPSKPTKKADDQNKAASK